MNERLCPRSMPALIQLLFAETLWSEDSYQVVRADIGFRAGNRLDAERIR
jgi:hypothetical protein